MPETPAQPDTQHAWEYWLMLAWVVLPAGRWLIMPIFQAAGVVSPQMLAALDTGIFLKIYLLLSAAILVACALRFTHEVQKKSSSRSGGADSSGGISKE